MKKSIGKYPLAITAIALAMLAFPAAAVQVSFSGSNLASTGTVSGDDTLGDTWVTSNGPELENSSFTMADSVETPQQFNVENFSNGLGNFANSFQLTVNKSQQGSGFKGILLTPVASGLFNEFMVRGTGADSALWFAWTTTYNLMDSASGLYQQILFTAPTGTQLSQGQDFKMDVNFSGIMTTDSGWAASWDDRAAPDNNVPEPGSLALMGIGMMGLVGSKWRKKA